MAFRKPGIRMQILPKPVRNRMRRIRKQSRSCPERMPEKKNRQLRRKTSEKKNHWLWRRNPGRQRDSLLLCPPQTFTAKCGMKTFWKPGENNPGQNNGSNPGNGADKNNASGNLANKTSAANTGDTVGETAKYFMFSMAGAGIVLCMSLRRRHKKNNR